MQNGNTPMDAYEIYDQIGAGGGGSVFRAFHKRLQKEVVIKKMHTGNVSEEIRRMEVDILKNLHHPYIPQVFDYFVIDGIGYTVMDFIRGENLGQKLNSGYRFKESQVIKYAKQLCEALDYLHSQKIPIIHGDIKPDNIMLTPEDNICLIDFNISGITKGENAVTFGYTPGYGAPEQYAAFMRLKQNAQAQPVNPMVQGVPAETPYQNAAGEKTEVLGFNNAEKTEVLNYAQDPKTEVLGYAVEQKTEVLSYGADQRTEVLQYNDMAQQQMQMPVNMIPQQAPMPVNMVPQQDVNRQFDVAEGIPIDKRSDVYSVGATIYHLYAGHRIDQSNGSLLKARTSDGFLYILNRALQNNPNARFQNAGEMLKALNSIHKLDRRYKNMQFRHNLFWVFNIFLIFGGILLVYFGNQMKKTEREDIYSQYVEELTEYRGESDVESFEDTYAEAVEVFPDRIEALFERSLLLYEIKEYEECIYYIEDEVLTISAVYEQESIAEIYYILGNCYFELEMYEEANSQFRNAIYYNNEVCAFYVDQAITLARLDDIEGAREALEAAEDLGIANDNFYLVTGEIDLANGEYESADENFVRCIEETDDSYVMLRAYVMRSTIYENLEANQENIDANIAVLLEAKNELPIDYQIIILERLAQAYIDGLSLTSEEIYAQNAISIFNEIIDMGWSSFNTYNNLAILYQKIGDFENAARAIEEMEGINSEHYVVYKRYAFLEIEIQNSKEQNERDYSQFVVYYEKAMELYEEQMNENQTDGEILFLQQLYQQLVDGLWI